MITLGIETSCDETSAALVLDGRFILSNVTASSLKLHQRYKRHNPGDCLGRILRHIPGPGPGLVRG